LLQRINHGGTNRIAVMPYFIWFCLHVLFYKKTLWLYLKLYPMKAGPQPVSEQKV